MEFFIVLVEMLNAISSGLVVLKSGSVSACAKVCMRRNTKTRLMWNLFMSKKLYKKRANSLGPPDVRWRLTANKHSILSIIPATNNNIFRAVLFTYFFCCKCNNRTRSLLYTNAQNILSYLNICSINSADVIGINETNSANLFFFITTFPRTPV